MPRTLIARGCPCPVAGRSLRPSWASLTRTWLRSGIHACACQLRRLSGHGQPRAAATFALLCLSLVFTSLFASPALASSPHVSIILPRGVQRGGDRELEFRGERLGDVREVFLHGTDGITVKSLQPVDDKSFKAVIHVPESCPAGEQFVQVRAQSGISEFRSFWVGILPILDEAEPNTFTQPQVVPLGHTIHGIVTAEDVDCFAVDLTKGQRLGVEIEGLRLGSYRFDPHVSIIDAKRFQLAAADDSPASMQDGILSILAPEDGRYVVQVREASYGGDDNCRYRLHIGTFPRPTAVFPAGGKAGEKLKVTFLGDAAGPIDREIEVPAGPVDRNHRLFVTDDGGTCPTAVPFRVSTLGSALEQEPNDEIGAATAADVSLAFDGVIGQPGDVDHYRFAARKGQTFEVECFARRLRSGLDPVVHVLAEKGNTVAGNDDAKGPDSAFRFEVPEDGDYLVRVKDHLGRGQGDFTYRVELTPPAPSLSLSIPRIDRFSQTRQTVFVPRGSRYAVLLNATRTNFDGDLVLGGGGLPAGVTLEAPPFKAGQGQIPVVFSAAADAPVGGGLVTLEARQVTEQDPEGTTGVRGHFENVSDFVLSDPNNSVLYAGRVDKLAVAVIDAVPFSVELTAPEAPLVRNGSLDLRVTVTREAGFDKPVTVEFPFRPAGVSANPSIEIPPDKSEATYQLNADAKAATGTWRVHVVAAGDVNGTAWVASAPVSLEVAEPFTTATLMRASCEQGQSAQVACTLAHARPFEGEAVARLQGLPPEASAPELKFTKDTKDLVFPVATTAKTPPGNHKSVFVEVVTPVGGGQARMTGGGAELKVVQPSGGAVSAPAADPSAQAAKPVSRLEQLRQQAQRPAK